MTKSAAKRVKVFSTVLTVSSCMVLLR